MTYTCPKCGNSDSRFLGIKNGRYYCRLCIAFQGKEVGDYKVDDAFTSPELNYPLSKNQQEISNKIVDNYRSNKSTLIHAVCGSGKTELVYSVISEVLSSGKHVGFAVPRREVVIDLLPRIKSAFPERKVICVYGGHADELEADVTLLTTHQLYRYNAYFDLLILDEIDAFPFKDNTLLINLFNRSIKGCFVMMSATPPDDVVNYFKNKNLPILELHTRYHQHPLPVPQVVIRIGYFKILFLLKKIKEYKEQNKPLMIFAPTIKKCEEIYKIIKLRQSKGMCVHSKCENRNEIVKSFKDKKYDYLVTTSILERGVTIKDVQIIIYDADSDLYDKGVLIQISGRAGRKIDAPTGEVIFLVNKSNESIIKAINDIERDNSFL